MYIEYAVFIWNIRDMKATLHWSMTKYYDVFEKTKNVFVRAWINVIAPIITEKESEKDGFVYSRWDDTTKWYVYTETNFLSKVASLDPRKDFAYIINPHWALGASGSAELAFLLSQHKNIFALKEITDPPLPMPHNYVYSPGELTTYYEKKWQLPKTNKINAKITEMLKSTFYALPAVGWIVIDKDSKEYHFGNRKEKEIILVKSPSWWWKYTLVGWSKLPGETDQKRLLIEFQEQLWISRFLQWSIIAKFPELWNGYREFTDYILYANLSCKKDRIIKLPPTVAIESWILEPNALKTVKLYRASLWG